MLKEKVFELLIQIPKGKVTTYSELGRALGSKYLARVVGNALNKNENPDRIPCFKVVKSNGDVGGFAFGQKEKIRRLERDGIKVKAGKVDLRIYLFVFKR